MVYHSPCQQHETRTVSQISKDTHCPLQIILSLSISHTHSQSHYTFILWCMECKTFCVNPVAPLSVCLFYWILFLHWSNKVGQQISKSNKKSNKHWPYPVPFSIIVTVCCQILFVHPAISSTPPMKKFSNWSTKNGLLSAYIGYNYRHRYDGVG